MSTPPKRREKKSETVEIRLPYSQKQDFMAACRAQGTTASDAIRDFIAEYVERTHGHDGNVVALRQMPRKSALIAAGVGAGALLLGAVPAAADTVDVDANQDGVVSTQNDSDTAQD